MKIKELCKYLFLYIKYRIKEACFFLFIYCTALCVFFLSGVDIETSIYSLFLSMFIGIFFVIFDIKNFINKLKLLAIGQMPVINNPLDMAYQNEINNLRSEINDIVTSNESSKRDTIDYYTMWVHQIKTPIAAMRLLLQDKDEAEVENELFKIEQYVEMVLSYLRMDSDSTDYVFKKHNLEKIVRQVIRKFARLFIKKKIKINVLNLDGDILSDEKWLNFVLEQILSNALKYTQSGCISIYQKSSGILVIEDTGIGIAKEDLPRIFDKGYTGYNGRINTKSTGIGLYLCKSIIDKLGHRMWVESEIGVGTKVYIDLNVSNIEIE